MGLNNTPSGERVHIGIFGKRNAGKSSLMNAMTGQNLAVVSQIEGTTTDPVRKALELLPLGPVVFIDTPGMDDSGEVGKLRVKKTYEVLNKSDLALLVVDIRKGLTQEDIQLYEKIQDKKIACMIVLNQCDGLSEEEREKAVQDARKKVKDKHTVILPVSAASGFQISLLKERLAALQPEEKSKKYLVRDLLQKGKLTVLVIPIDKAAPKGRLILPQQQTIRDILEAGETAVTVRDTELEETLKKLGDMVGLVITDSQVFEKVSEIVPEWIPMTSFSILFARYKGELEPFIKGAYAVEKLKNGDRVLISEGCTHHRQCNDIGTVKIPQWITQYTGKQIEFSFTSGGEFPDDLTPYQCIVHCGGCMLSEREMKYRIQCALHAGVPITNYGMLISMVKGILERSIRPLQK